MKREFLMLAQTYKKSKHAIGGWFMSEKLDGMRCFWDGGVSRGVPKKDVPWANNSKDDRYVNEPIATGLWTRLGNVIHAPDEWLDRLPRMPIDGELYSLGFRQDLMSTVKRLIGDLEAWENVELWAFDIPCFTVVFEGGYLNSTNFPDKTIDGCACVEFIRSKKIRWLYDPFKHRTFHTTQFLLERLCPGTKARYLDQERLPLMQREAEERLAKYLNTVADRGGEGIMLRNPDSAWEAERSWNLLKVKKLQDDEGTVVGYVTGRKTAKGSKLLGMMGALVLDYNGKRLELSGFTEAERVLVDEDGVGDEMCIEWAKMNPKTECPSYIHNPHFPRGTKVTFRYRGKSKDGIPQEARYWRKHVLS